jgi:GT2 family glycosyltransferase
MTKSTPPAHTSSPLVSVVVLNYNGQQWLPRCFESLAQQTIFSQIEVILTDNNSFDDSVPFTNGWLAHTGARGRVIQNGANLFYCGANNNGAAVATGEFLLFLNNDTWLEPDCLEKLYQEVTQAGADGGAPLVMDYDDNAYQSGGDSGMDWFGIAVGGPPFTRVTPTFASPGCSLLVRTALFHKIGGFAPELLIYVDETDLAWRVWIAGGKMVSVPMARLHHRGAAVVNPHGNTKTLESRTSDTKRFLTNRNGLLFLLKNSQHIFLLLLVPHIALLLAESVVSLLLVRRWSYVRKSYFSAFADVFRMRGHILEWRRRIRSFRRRGDFYMIRFLRLKPNRWWEFRRMLRFGPPKVNAK